MHILPATHSRASRRSRKEDVPWPGWLSTADIEKEHPTFTDDEYLSLSPAKQEAILSSAERQWIHVQPWLESNGYLLRPRFRPGWKPSWSEGATPSDLNKREDAVEHDVR